MGIFDGQSVQMPSGSVSSTETPKWFQELTYKQMLAAGAAYDKPYEAYALPRLAEQSPDQLAAHNLVRGNIGSWQPTITAAQSGLQNLTGQTAGFTRGTGMMDTAGSTGTAADLQTAQNQYLRPDLAQTGLNAGQALYGRAAGMDIVGAAQPYLGQSSAATAQSLSERAMASANPYLQAAANKATTGISGYMSPYTTGVTDEIARLGARNLREQLLPNVSDAFIRAGQFGGTRMGEFGSRALRDTQESILGQQSQALQQGYGQALQASQADLARQAQLAGTVGSISGADLSRILQGAGQYGTLGQTAGQLAGQQMQNLGQLGQYQTSAGQAQQQYGFNAAQAAQAAKQSDLARMLQAGQGITTAAGQEAARQQGALASMADMERTRMGMAAQDAAALQSIGQENQAQQQKQLDIGYQDWKAQQDYPKQQLDWLQAQLKGVGQYVPTTTTSSGYSTAMSPSPLSQMAQAYFGSKALGVV